MHKHIIIMGYLNTSLLVTNRKIDKNKYIEDMTNRVSPLCYSGSCLGDQTARCVLRSCCQPERACVSLSSFMPHLLFSLTLAALGCTMQNWHLLALFIGNWD